MSILERENLEKVHAAIHSGYAGVMSNGNIVDRREYPEAVPIPRNDLLDVPEPKQIGHSITRTQCKDKTCP
jgi:hypothetical protein